jgi:hypothetical protein
MFDMTEDTVQFKVTVPKSLSERFREVVSAKHGFQRGALSYEVTIALSQYIATYKQIQNTKNSMSIEESNPIPKVYDLKKSVFEYLVSSGMYEEVPQFIPDRHLMTAIGYVKGTDRRTIKKWTEALRRYGCIKISGPHQYEFV